LIFPADALSPHPTASPTPSPQGEGSARASLSKILTN